MNAANIDEFTKVFQQQVDEYKEELNSSLKDETKLDLFTTERQIKFLENKYYINMLLGINSVNGLFSDYNDKRKINFDGSSLRFSKDEFDGMCEEGILRKEITKYKLSPKYHILNHREYESYVRKVFNMFLSVIIWYKKESILLDHINNIQKKYPVYRERITRMLENVSKDPIEDGVKRNLERTISTIKNDKLSNHSEEKQSIKLFSHLNSLDSDRSVDPIVEKRISESIPSHFSMYKNPKHKDAYNDIIGPFNLLTRKLKRQNLISKETKVDSMINAFSGFQPQSEPVVWIGSQYQLNRFLMFIQRRNHGGRIFSDLKKFLKFQIAAKTFIIQNNHTNKLIPEKLSKSNGPSEEGGLLEEAVNSFMDKMIKNSKNLIEG